MKNFVINPVLNKEFKLRFRSYKSFLGLLFYLLALAILIVGFVFIESLTSSQGFFKPEQSRMMFMMLSVLQLILILFITPGLTAGVISSERERQTLNIMLTTAQSSASIILSKLISSISFLMLLIIASLPLYSFVFLYGGISPQQVLTTVVYYSFTILGFGSLGVLFSTLIRKTIVSMVTTYAVTLFLVGGTAFLTLILLQFGQGYYNTSTASTPPTVPYAYFTAMLNPVIVLAGSFEPGIHDEIYRITGIKTPLWVSYTLSYTVIFIGAILFSIKKLRPNMKKGK
ncbi:ABC-2 type transport system permease protein [Cytobacillus horneckiae]|uniref:ABC transporter permease n=1 Tax=Cytobacillus horneckiae TaxID=549687 RepID=A0A2N0ZM68_9BACI|nr:ABC transporter permease subunit [Cytobacillus horneckiae]MBN6887130.1 ABC transporter permease subunit [Cytobacillus horneckiae]MCM3178279.1 ABC transporter permease subunit [Cytobacillus horneckiae]MEC1156981.1 ABC transporter permease subunit [Cytobacillus horneckiae]MED2939993.1 ABC transporter permease subunit [Cytobacillus horneckiae]PKG30587.1 ABC transporter permease [Cytobacillus horneckiae]